MLLANVPPREACKPPAPKGSKDSALEKKKRAETLSWPARNSRSQLVVNWSSVYLPGRLMMKGAELTLTEQVSASTVTPGVPGTEGSKNPLASPPNWLLLKFKSDKITGSMAMGTAGQPPGLIAVGAVAGVLKVAARFPAVR